MDESTPTNSNRSWYWTIGQHINVPWSLKECGQTRRFCIFKTRFTKKTASEVSKKTWTVARWPFSRLEIKVPIWRKSGEAQIQLCSMSEISTVGDDDDLGCRFIWWCGSTIFLKSTGEAGNSGALHAVLYWHIFPSEFLRHNIFCFLLSIDCNHHNYKN